MSTIRAFKALRPTREYASKVAALPYDVMNSDEARIKVQGNPYSFLHVDKAEIDLPRNTYLYSDEVYKKAAENLKRLESDGICVQDEKKLLYIYRQVMGDICQTGIVGCASIDDYISGVIKRHELTRADKEEDRIRHVDTCDANTGPIFLAYRRNSRVDEIIEKYTALEPEYDFVSEGEVRNTVWVITDGNDIEAVISAFEDIKSLYIADGHHRAASAVKVGMKRRETNPDYNGNEEFNFFLAVFFRADELKILDYNRLLKDTNSHSDEELFLLLEDSFTIKESPVAVSPERKHSFGMYYKNKWYALELKNGIADDSNPVESLDVSVLQKEVIERIFGISDPRTDSRIDFVGGIRGLGELEKRCREDAVLAFSMYPTSLDELMAIADAGEIMPPKSTWFEPKLLSGLFIHKLK